MNDIELIGTIAQDATIHYGPGNPYYPPGGGAETPPPGGMNVRTLHFTPEQPITGDMAAAKFAIPAGIVFVDATGQAVSAAGKRVKIIIQEIAAE